MLVLARKKNQSIIIGNGTIKLTIHEIRSDVVRLGIEAPKEVPVHREEVWLRIKRRDA